jgi:TatD DNase family protein
MGFYIGVGGVITFKNGRKLREVVDVTPMDRILLETDCPYLAPEPYRGKRNNSTYLPYVVKEIAAIKGISEEEVQRITLDNARRMYGI